MFVARGDGSLASIARPGDQVPGGTLRTAGAASISGNGGHIAFAGRLVGATRATPSSSGEVGGRSSESRPGDPAPGGGVLVDARLPRVNSRGEVLFGGLVRQAGQPTLRSLFLASQGSIKAVARLGDRMPGWLAL